MTANPTTPEGRAELRAAYDHETDRGQSKLYFDGDVRALWIDHRDGNADGLAHPIAIWGDGWAELIVAAVNALPALLDQLDEAEFEIERQHGDLVIERRHGTAQYRRAEKAEAQLAEAQDTIRGYESAVEGLATTIGEQRQQLSAIRAYAQELHALADTTRDAGGDYLAHTYREIATALERKIGGAS